MRPQISHWLHIHGGAQYLGIVLKTATLLSATLVLFSGDLSVSHVLAIPVIAAYLVFRKRKVIQAAISLKHGRNLFSLISLDTVAGGLLLLASVGFYWHASYTMMSLEYHILAMIMFLSSCILILFNSSVLRQLIFPILLLSLLFPPAEILYNTGSALSVVSSTITFNFLKAVGYPVSLNNEYENPWLQVVQQDGTPVSFSVDPACSGIYSLMGFLVFALFIAYLVRGSAWKKIVAFSVGFPLIYSLNIARLVTTVLVGYYYGEAIALSLFHVFGGWILVFIGTLFLLVSLRRIFSINLDSKPFRKCETCENPASRANPGFCFSCGRLLTNSVATLDRSDLVRVLVVLIAVTLITVIQMPIFLNKGPTELVVNASGGQEFSTDVLPQVEGYSLAYVDRDREFETYAKQDLSLIYSYVPNNGTEDTIWVLLEVASIRSSLHRTEACLIKWYAAGEKVEGLLLRDYQLLENPPIVGRFCVFHYTRSDPNQTVIYWFQNSVLSINSTIVEKYVKVSLVSYPTSLDQISDSENRLFAFAKSVTNYWQPIHQWSQVALVLSRSRYVLLSLPPSLLVGMILYVLFQKGRDKKADAQAYQKLPERQKQVVNAIGQAQRSGKPIFSNVLSMYRKLTGQPVEKQEFYDMLLAVEKTRVVEGGFVNVDDYPLKAWRTGVDFQ
jgi:exosortase/archaeosortase family protein